MKRRHALLLALLALVTAFATGIVYVRMNTLDEQRIALDVTVDADYAFNLDTDAFHFGRVIPGGAMTRGFLINNTQDKAVLAELYIEGDIARFITASETSVVVGAHEARTVDLTVSIPRNATFTTHTGELRVIFRRTP